MKKRRIFIAINLPDKTKRKILEVCRQWADLPMRWTKEDNLHITLVFIGYVDEEQLLEVCQIAKQAVKKSHPFEIKFNHICLGPSEKQARMIWLKGEISQDLIRLRNSLESDLLQNGCFHKKERFFKPHITLARIRQREWKSMKYRPEIDKDISLSFPVDSIEIMESYLSSKGSDYVILESIPLDNY